MTLLDKAIAFAAERHSGMVRKGADIPYIIHPLEAVSITVGITSNYEILVVIIYSKCVVTE